MSYFSLDINCSADFVEIFMAELSELGFSTFQEKENETGVLAYADEGVEIPRVDIEAFVKRYEALTQISYTTAHVEKENWNADWEKNYDPIIVDDKILVRASFHPSDSAYDYEIIVTPKMSFGTGHHETTHQLLSLIYKMDLNGKTVLDAGCGTGILGIMAIKKGAATIDAYDIDEWAVENSIENFELNAISESIVNVWKGDVETVKKGLQYDIILANINRNILLNDIKSLTQHLNTEGMLLLSGFYEQDINDILTEAAKYSLLEKKRTIKNDWAALVLSKNS
ncbi:MAG: ribosomal protein L11 methyltransferase [Marivirga sp.]|jgi:ribosomal protein L11 methyltransferase